jgi:hypothetical protein
MVRPRILIISVLAVACLPSASSVTCESFDRKVTCACPGGCVSMATSCYCEETSDGNGQYALFGDFDRLSASGLLGRDDFADGGVDMYL